MGVKMIKSKNSKRNKIGQQQTIGLPLGSLEFSQQDLWDTCHNRGK